MIADEILAEKTKLGDMRAFEELVKRYRNPVFVAIKRIRSNSQDAEDVFQEVFISAYRNIEQFDARRATFKTWLFGIVKNRCIDSLRRTKVRQTVDEVCASEAHVSEGKSEDGFARVEFEELFERALECLSEEQRLCLTLKAIGDLGYEEITQIVGVPVGTVKSRISSARRRLAEQIRNQRESDVSCNVSK